MAYGSEKRVLIRDAERSETNSRFVTLTVNALVPEGSVLKVQKKAFERKAAGELTVDVESELDTALVLLASQALFVTRESFYDDPTIAPVVDADKDPAAMRSVLETHLSNRNSPPDVTSKALAAYDAMSADIVPSQSSGRARRAHRPFSERAIVSILTGDNCTDRPAARLVFQPPPGNPELVARVTHAGGARVISMNPFAEGERIEHLMPILAHEAIHCDREDGIFEEVAATAFDGFLYLQLVSASPELATLNTKVARELNIDAVAMINSGQRYPESIGILRSPGVTAALP